MLSGQHKRGCGRIQFESKSSSDNSLGACSGAALVLACSETEHLQQSRSSSSLLQLQMLQQLTHKVSLVFRPPLADGACRLLHAGRLLQQQEQGTGGESRPQLSLMTTRRDLELSDSNSLDLEAAVQQRQQQSADLPLLPFRAIRGTHTGTLAQQQQANRKISLIR